MLLWAMFHTDLIGVFNTSHYSNTELDTILNRIMSATNEEEYMQAAKEAQQFVVENAIVIPTYTPKSFQAINLRVQGAVVSPINGQIYLDNAFIEPED